MCNAFTKFKYYYSSAATIEVSPLEFKAARGKELRCKGWRQEGILRMLENTLENAEKPEELVVYSAIGKAARNIESYRKIREILKELEDGETLLIQSGKPIVVFKTHRLASIVLMANNCFVPRWRSQVGDRIVEKTPTPETFHEFASKGLTVWPSYTAGAWAYIGHQGISHGTYQTFAVAAQKRFGGSLEGRLVLTAGLGQMGGAQPLAAAMNGGVCIGVEVNQATVNRMLKRGWIDVSTEAAKDALDMAKASMESKKGLGIGLVGNAAQVFPDLLAMGIVPDIVTDMTPAHDPLSYVPNELTVDSAKELRQTDPNRYWKLAAESARKEVEAMIEFQKRGAMVFEYGNDLRQLAFYAGLQEAFGIKSFVAELLRPLLCLGRGPFRWIALSGDKEDIYRLDDLVLDEFANDEILTKWIRLARKRIPFEGLPARICWLGYGQRAKFAKEANRMVADGALNGPIAFTRDLFDSGSITQPNTETEGMRDGSDPIADWPLLNALINTAAGADLVAINQGSGIMYYVAAGVSIIADGTTEAEQRLDRVLTVDPGLGVVRHADAGYETAIEFARKEGIAITGLK